MATSAAKSKGKKKVRRSSAKETGAVRGARNQMWAVVVFALGILLGALTFYEGDKLWKVLHGFLFGMFGLTSYFLSPLLIYISVAAAMEKPLSSVRAKLWQVAVLIAIISGAFQIFGPGLPARETLVDNVKFLYSQGSVPKGGGIIGALTALPLLLLFEKTGASIIISLLAFVFVMLITGSTLMGLVRAAKKPVEGLEDAYAEHMAGKQERKSKTAEKPSRSKQVPEAAPKFDIDVDISGDTVVSPAPEPEQGPAARNRLLHLAGAGTDSPVEYISAADLRGAQPDAEPAAAHPLEQDITEAETKDDVSEIVDLFMQSPQPEPPPWEEYIASLPQTQPLYDDDNPAQTPPDTPPLYPTETPPAPPAPVQYVFPPTSLLNFSATPSGTDVSEELKQNAQILVDTLKSFGVQTRMLDICRGPSVTRYELQPAAGVKISKITNLSDDIALNLACAGIRIEAPIPNKAAVGIEVPNKNVSVVSIREMLESYEFQSTQGVLTVALGKDIAGNITLADIGRMPHVLIAGSTGSGKSVCINSIIMSLLYKYSPDEVKLLMVDPKVVELGIYNGVPHLLVPVVTDPKKAAGALNWAVGQMLERYKMFADHGVKDLAGYNRLAESDPELAVLPKVVIVIDELADLMMAAPNEVEDSICRLAQMARAAGMHLVIATQRPSVDVITGLIKANIPSRVAFAVSSQIDSRTILDMGGAEKLLGRGDMLFYPVGVSKPLRVQGCFVTEKEVESVVDFIKESAAPSYDDAIMEDIDRLAVVAKGKGKNAPTEDFTAAEGEDDMLPQAIECVVEAGQASTSQLQRRLKLGYARAARIIDQLEQKGVVGPFEGSKPRQVLISKERWMEMKLSGAEDSLLNQTRLHALPPDDPVIPPERGGVKARPDEFEFANL